MRSADSFSLTAGMSSQPDLALSRTLLGALRQGNLGLLHALLALRTRGAALTAELDARLEAANQNTLLTYAAYYGQADAVRLLLEGGASVGATTGRGWSALFAACQKGHLECVRLLLEAHAAVDQPTDKGTTPLSAASMAGQIDCVRLMIAAGAAVTKQTLTASRRCSSRARMVTSRSPGCLSRLARRSTKPRTAAARPCTLRARRATPPSCSACYGRAQHSGAHCERRDGAAAGKGGGSRRVRVRP